MKKTVAIVVIILVFLVLLVPIPFRLKDGGSVEYKALLYSITDVHRLNPDMQSEQAYLEGTIIEILGMEVFNNVEANRTDDFGGASEDTLVKPKTIEPPELNVVCADESVTALMGTYSWEYINEDGTYTGMEVDSAHPLECKDNMPDIGIFYATTSALHPGKAYLQFDVNPSEVEVRYWSEEDWNNVNAESEKLNVLVLAADYEDGSNSTSYSIKLQEGNYIYEVVAKWNGSEEYSGTVHYSFYTVMGDYELVPVSE